MSQTQHPSEACCNTPPIVTHDYKEKGTFTQVDGLKTYQTGPKDAKRGILFVYDIFGYFPQTLQGADILASSDSHKYQVFMPDFFEGKPADISWYPPDTEEKGKKLGQFFSTTAAPPKAVERIGSLMSTLKKEHKEIQDWGIVGFCWGGKIVNLVSGPGTVFKAAAAAHPAMVDAADAPNVTIPILLLPTKDESKEDVEKYEKALKVKNSIVWFPEQIHGFMAARGDLSDSKVVSAYERGYQLFLGWFHSNMGDNASRL